MKAIRWIGASLGAAAMVMVAGTVLAEVSGPMASVVQASRVAPRVMDQGDRRVVPLARGGSGYMGEFSLAPGAELTMREGVREEYLYVLQGSALLSVDGTTFFLGPRMGVYIPGGAEVSWVNGSRRFTAVQFFPAGSPYIDSESWIQEEESRPPRRRRSKRVPTRVSVYEQ